MKEGRTDHLLPKKIKALERSHRLRTRLRISKSNMRLASHLVIPKSDDIKNRAIGCEESIEREAEVRFSDLFREVGQVQSVIV